MENLNENAGKKYMTASKNDKTQEKRWNMSGRKRICSTRKNDNATRGNKAESTDERMNTKYKSRHIKIMQKNPDIPKQEKILPTSSLKTYQQLAARVRKQLWNNIWQRGKHNQKAESISNMEIELEVLEEGVKAKIKIDSCRITPKNTKLEKKMSWRHTWILVKKNSPPSTTDKLSKYIADVTEFMTKRMTISI